MDKRKYLQSIFIALLLVGMIIPTSTARAGSSITVTTTSDELNQDGDCSLREAIVAANTDQAVDACPAGNGEDTIYLPDGTYRLTRTGSGEDEAHTGDLDLTESVKIYGERIETTIVDGNEIDRVFHIPGAINVEFRNLTIQKGLVSGPSAAGRGGGIRVAQNAVVNIQNSLLQSNEAATYGGAIDNVSGILTIVNSTFYDNKARDGAGIFNGGTLVIQRSLMYANEAAVYGGALDNNNRATLSNTTISSNSAALDPQDPNGGGGIYNDGTISLFYSTITNNSGVGIVNKGSSEFVSVLVSDNQDVNCTGTGAFLSQGFNLEDEDTCKFTQSNDIVGRAAQLDVLEDNGGPTMTHALLPNSPAIDASDSPDCPGTDQRGAIRPADGDRNGSKVCDIGAFEFNAAYNNIYMPFVLRNQ